MLHILSSLDFPRSKEYITEPVEGEVVASKKVPEKKLKEPPKSISLKEKGLLPPKLIKKVEPVYPENCAKDEIERTVILEATTRCGRECR